MLYLKQYRSVCSVAIITCVMYFPYNLIIEDYFPPQEPVEQNPTIENINDLNKWEINEEIQIFREYLRIPSVHPDIDYGKHK